jgi:hypothetical protein
LVLDVFSKRNRPQSAEPLVRDVLPEGFRIQASRILQRALGSKEIIGFGGEFFEETHDVWRIVHDQVAEEHGLHHLTGGSGNKRKDCVAYLCRVEAVAKALDLIEVGIRAAERIVPQIPSWLHPDLGITESAEDAIGELNARFGEHNLGYQYLGGQIVRVDSEYLHKEVSEPALQLLHAHGFDGPEEEFRSAHDHFRHGRLKEATVDALKAFESVMKAICDARKWSYDPRAQAKDLIAVVLNEGLIPEYLQTEISGLRNLLEASVPTVRNKMGGHGQGATTKPMPPHLAAYALHSAASNIVLLIQAHQALK